MEAQALVLSVSYEPFAIIDWRQAIVWILDKVAEVVDEHQDRYIRTVSWSVKTPSVVRLLKPVKRNKALKFSRYNVYLRDKGKCQYCGISLSRDDFTYDHVVPRAQGGRTEWGNVICCCVRCNQKKAGRTPEQAGMRLLAVPVKPKSLPNMNRQIFYRDGMPESWKSWLRAEVYWQTELENDG